MRVGVAGYGVVGRRTVAHLVERADVDEVLVLSPAHPATSKKVRRVDERELRAQAAVVVLTTPSPQQSPAAVLLDAGCHVVTTSDDCADVDALIAMERAAQQAERCLVVGAAASPGMTGLLGRLAAGDLDSVDELHVTIHGTGGPACARQHHEALGSTSRNWYDGAWQERPGGTGRELCWFPDPIGAHDCYRAALPDPVLLHRSFPSASRITARLTATRRDRLTARLPMLRRPHPEAREGGLRVEVRGHAGVSRDAVVLGVACPLGAVAAAMASVAAAAAGGGRFPTGLVVLGDEALPTRDLARQVAGAGVAIHRFTGTASQTSW